jgi:glycopeptide antibiotics resistance protein
MKKFFRAVLVSYTLVLLWLLLFKFSYDPLGVVLHYHERGLNLVPFAGYAQGALKDAVPNAIVFIPLGLLLSVTMKQVGFWRKLMYMCCLSISVEAVQYIAAIGRTDITDVMTNTLGGCIGLVLYKIGRKCLGSDASDWLVSGVIAFLLVVLLVLRTLVFRVRY